MARRIEISVLAGEEEGGGTEEHRILKERSLLGLEGRVGCKFDKGLGIKLEEMEMAEEVGLVGCAISSGDWIWD